MTAMNIIFLLLSFQAALGAFDNLWHHELEARLPHRTSARYELSLHAAREAIYGVVFFGLAWFEWRGAFAAVLAALLLIELVITLADFLEEDRTRRLPPLERLLHTVLTISYGLFLGLIAPVLWAWVQQPTAMAPAPHGWVSWLFTAYAIGVWAWSVRNVLAAIQLYRMAAEPAPPSALHAHGLQPQPATLVTGATGFVGSALVADLVRDGQRVIVLTRDALQARASFGPSVWGRRHGGGLLHPGPQHGGDEAQEEAVANGQHGVQQAL
ncbi:MAG: NAD-dependent epimerase/dehydratase family protein, partial [Comamonadaceae bacterium]